MSWLKKILAYVSSERDTVQVCDLLRSQVADLTDLNLQLQAQLDDERKRNRRREDELLNRVLSATRTAPVALAEFDPPEEEPEEEAQPDATDEEIMFMAEQYAENAIANGEKHAKAEDYIEHIKANSHLFNIGV